jgi:hypothetical protein
MHDLYVSPHGNDNWSGQLAAPNAAGTDGPFATIEKARDTVRDRKARGQLRGMQMVWLRGGRYALKQPLVFAPEDSAPVTYAAYPDEEPVLDGGRAITDWKVEERNGTPLWVAELPEVAAGDWYFRQLWVDGARRPRARLPKVGRAPEQRNFYFIEDVPGSSLDDDMFMGTDAFVAAPGDIQPWRNLTDVEVVALHFWVEERMPIVAFDAATRLVRSSRKSIFVLKDDWLGRWAKYYVDNVFEALTEPGEWYLDRAAGRLYYLPLPGETPDNVEVYAPRIEQLLKLQGQPEQSKFVEFVRFQGLTFHHTEWHQLGNAYDVYAETPAGAHFAASPQAAVDLPGVIALQGARYCALEACKIEHIGWYAMDLGDGCVGNRIVGNEIADMGAGGIKANGGDAPGPQSLRTGNNVITDNHIHDGGQVFHSAVGIILRHSFGNVVAHNHIHDLFYTAISCGWVWGYAEGVSRDNLIEKNHIHDLGFGWLSDMGGIYTLGVQPGTVIHNNLIHDVEKANYGGWAIYPDEGSSHILIENNIGYNTTSQPFHQHYGRENIVRNNIFAFGGEGQIAITRAEPHLSMTFERNIVVTHDQPIFEGTALSNTEKQVLISDLNLYWNVAGDDVSMREGVDMEEWRSLGQDTHSIIADPLCVDVESFDFALLADSPAFALGFKPIDMSGVGPRPVEQRGQ